MSTLSWHSLRSLAGSQHNAFEELCCQLAAHEPAPTGAEYRRIGAPDAGVECIWRNPDGSVHGWQAKFFLHSPTTGEWKQLDESVHQAIDHYPELSRYTICLPIDRPDARLPQQKSMMARWDDRVARWTQYAADRGRQVVFDYWGEHEITDRLARMEHAGRRYYFFNEHSLGPEWFQQRFETARISVGERYSPKLNLELEISGTFDALTRHARFTENVRRQWGVVRRELGRVIPTNPALHRSVGTVPSQLREVDADARAAARNAVAPALAIVEQAADAARVVVATLTVDVPAPIPFGVLEEAFRRLRDALEALETAMEAGDAAARAVRTAAASLTLRHAAAPAGSGPTIPGGSSVATHFDGSPCLGPVLG